MDADDGTEDWEERCSGCESCDCGDCMDDDDYDDDTRDCHWCGGDGWAECNDPIQCTSQHDEFGMCRCSSCGGSGAAKDMTIW